MRNDRLHIIDNPVVRLMLARVRPKDASRDEARRWVRELYHLLTMEMINQLFLLREASVPTPLQTELGERGVWRGLVPNTQTSVVVTAIARGGLLPSDVVLDALTALGFENARMDILTMNRTTDATGHVNGVEIQGSKTGSTVNGAIVVYPDPMLATGGSLLRAVEHYASLPGTACWHVALSLIAAPEGAERFLNAIPNAHLFTGALDGGLTAYDYIWPGAGDMGNKLNGPSDAVIRSG
ncbi:MAG: uracil phosphoribosyltransferase [Candidatus Magasanikbacteria bacterium]|nr:uracil phosphoribosyltransferase [Candidatus Magasanikbacteria bacterium]